MGISKCLFNTTLRYMGAKRLFHRAARTWRAELDRELGRALGDAVRTGPFAGMILPDVTSWGDGDRVAKLLGSYEANLHPHLLRAAARRPATVVNVGCAEGFYAIGMARLLPEASVFAFDIDERARSVCEQAASLNGVSARVTAGGLCTPEILDDLGQRPGGVLVVMDCEGAEKDLLDPVKAPALSNCDMLVEVHDFAIPDLTGELEQRFSGTHSVERIAQGPRDPNTVPELARMDEIDRWLAISEGRPEAMTWLACWSHPMDGG